jgi:hypothetical protein
MTWTLRVLLLMSLLVPAGAARAHDWRRPDLNDWYGSLKRLGIAATIYGVASCCSRTDCHTTQAELRDGSWWARIGMPRQNGDWDLLDWVRVPPETVLQQHDNTTGEGVICHSTASAMGARTDSKAVSIWCFVPLADS